MKMKMIVAGSIAAMLAMVGVSSDAASATGENAGEAIVASASAEAAAAQAGAAQAAETAEAAAPRMQRRAQLTPEKRAEMRAQREKFMAERKAAMESKALEVVKKYVPDEAQAKALLAELQAVLMPSRRFPAAKQPVEKKAE